MLLFYFVLFHFILFEFNRNGHPFIPFKLKWPKIVSQIRLSMQSLIGRMSHCCTGSLLFSINLVNQLFLSTRVLWWIWWTYIFSIFVLLIFLVHLSPFWFYASFWKFITASHTIILNKNSIQAQVGMVSNIRSIYSKAIPKKSLRK